MNAKLETNNEKILDTRLNFYEDSFDQIETNFEKDEIIKKDVFFTSKKKIRKIGNMFTFLHNKDDVPLIAIGPHCIII